MSAYIAVAYPDRIEMLADTAYLDGETGILLSLAPKISAHPSAAFMVMLRTGDLLHDMITYVGKAHAAVTAGASYDEAVEETANIMRTAPMPQAIVELILCGLVDGRPKMTVLQLRPREGFHSHDTSDGDLVMGGSLTSEEIEATGFQHETLARGVEPGGMKLMTAFRNSDGGFGHYAVGGQVQLATLRPSGVNVRTIGYWPDLIGSPISPGRQFVWSPPALSAGKIGVLVGKA